MLFPVAFKLRHNEHIYNDYHYHNHLSKLILHSSVTFSLIQNLTSKNIMRGVHRNLYLYRYISLLFVAEDAEAFQLIRNRRRESVAAIAIPTHSQRDRPHRQTFRNFLAMGVTVNCILLVCMSCFFMAVVALKCHQCGQYNDGVGSITPCINSTYMKLKDCPSMDHRYCIVSV